MLGGLIQSETSTEIRGDSGFGFTAIHSADRLGNDSRSTLPALLAPIVQTYPPSDPPPPPAVPTSTGNLVPAPTAPSAPLPSQYLPAPGTPTPSAAVISPQPLEKAIFAPLVRS
ncbi:hypothetical protein FRC01_004317 [Tulasnella sp. 417]|nr:hypothetical protein FRC01_004317 [Tulasnella sp. 417]